MRFNIDTWHMMYMGQSAYFFAGCTILGSVANFRVETIRGELTLSVE
jgi:hypothetical protein